MLLKKIPLSLIFGVIIGTTCGVFWGIPLNWNENLSTISREKTCVEVQNFQESSPITDHSAKIKISGVQNNLPENAHNEPKTLSPLSKKEQAPKELIIGKEKKQTPIHNNRTLKNFNVMFLGIEDKKLQMISVYSINKDNHWRSGIVFIPIDTLIPGTIDQSISQIFYTKGPMVLRGILEKNMEINISYYVRVDQNLLSAVEPHIKPVYINGEKVNIAELFTKEITPDDEKILAALLQNITEPSVYFGFLPKLVITCKQFIETDFSLTWENIWLHYQIAKNIDTTKVAKIILPGDYQEISGEKFWVPTQSAWWNTIYELTQKNSGL